MSASAARERTVRLACVALVLAAPAASTSALLAYCGYAPRECVPGFYVNDETLNYLQVQAFATHGFRAGYFGVEEEVAPASFSHFGVHGPAFPVLYGGLARLFGMSYGLATYLNVAALTLALAAYVALTRPANRDLLWLAGFALTFVPFYMVVFTWLQEALHYALAVAFAGLFAVLLGDPPPGRRRAVSAVTLAAVCLASLLRVSWASLLLPLFLLNRPGRSARATVAAAGLGCVATVACMKAFQMLCAPYKATAAAFLMNKLFTGGIDLGTYRDHVLQNVRVLFKYFTPEGYAAARNVLGQNFVLIALATALLARQLYLLRRRKRSSPPAAGGPRPARGRAASRGAGESFRERFTRFFADADEPVAFRWAAFLVYNQAGLLAATVLLYWVGNNGAIRILGVHLLLGLLVAFRAPLRVLRAVLPVSLALSVLVIRPTLREITDRFDSLFTAVPQARRAAGGRAEAGARSRALFSIERNIAAFTRKAAELIPFDPDADPWANTIFTDRIAGEFVGLPPGIGVEYYLHPKALARPIRSRYIIAVPDEAEDLLGPRVKFLAPVSELSRGALYFRKGRPLPNLYLNLAPGAPPPRGGGAVDEDRGRRVSDPSK